jgi:hypothetical protein
VDHEGFASDGELIGRAARYFADLLGAAASMVRI